jgi:hypothetical protein
MKQDPIRLKDDAGSPARMRADLAAESGEVAPAAVLLAAARLKTAIENGSRLSEVGELARGVKVTTELFAFKSLPLVLAALLVSGGVAIAVTLSAGGSHPSAPARLPAVAVTASASVEAPTTEVVPGEAPLVPPEPTVATSSRGTAPTTPRPTPSVAGQRAASAKSDVVAAEMADLERLRRLRGGDPEAALRAAEEGKTRFPHGLYDEDREAIAIELLVDLGRTSEAKRRGISFLASYPRSSFAEKVRLETGLAADR